MPRPVPSAILYQSVDREITLIDIPTSIALAQDRLGTLLSTAPLQEPITSKEEYQPKAGKNPAIDIAQHEIYKPLIEQALLDIKAHVSGDWCAPRQFLDKDAAETKEKELESRFREWAASEESSDDASFDFQTMMAQLGAPEVQPASIGGTAPWSMSYAIEGVMDQLKNVEEWSPAFYNAESEHLNLTISRTQESYTFTLPPLSGYCLADCSHPRSLRTSLRSLSATQNVPHHFDLVLMDPPWPNRSAKRKHAYEQIGGMPYLKKMLLKMDIDDYLNPSALVGIWITNKPALREHVLGPGGLFERWNVGLVEEWVWVKTTVKGEPMFDLGDTMRKPYEVLLLGRAAPNRWTATKNTEVPKRRVIAGVPDVHSRKPCLKELFADFMPDMENCSVLEVFARCLVSGWMAWGNEVLKYNEDMYWAR
jgi:N6-adenosine-specific RNA methylase IME4